MDLERHSIQMCMENIPKMDGRMWQIAGEGKMIARNSSLLRIYKNVFWFLGWLQHGYKIDDLVALGEESANVMSVSLLNNTIYKQCPESL